jgi:hypothetical protein
MRLVGVGMGVGGPEGVAAVKDFARSLGAGMCATRRVMDQGWMPRQLQVGLTSKAIDPRLYFAIGVRGGPNHTVGIKRAEVVVAINNDPEAPIFERATLGLVADLSVILPALAEGLKTKSSGGDRVPVSFIYFKRGRLFCLDDQLIESRLVIDEATEGSSNSHLRAFRSHYRICTRDLNRTYILLNQPILSLSTL